MFHDIPQAMLIRMRELEQIDSRDRTDGTPRTKRLRQIPSEVGRFIAVVAAAAPAGRAIEIGTSAGYSTLWLALGCRAAAEKEIEGRFYEAVVPNMVPGGFLVADNAINHETILRPMLDRAL